VNGNTKKTIQHLAYKERLDDYNDIIQEIQYFSTTNSKQKLN